jgi:hypothetical protein
MDLKHFFRPGVIKISLAFLCFGLTLLFLIPVFSHIKIIPCRIVANDAFSLCALNPLVQPGSMYFGLVATDFIYQLAYLALISVVLPYSIACFIFWVYEKLFKKNLNKDM